jgi:hypothetical protein
MADEMADERTKILEMIEQGTITATQGAELLLALKIDDVEQEEQDMLKTDPLPEPDPPPAISQHPIEEIPAPARAAYIPSQEEPTRSNPAPKFARWRKWWSYPLTFGILLTIFSGWLLYLGNQNAWAGFWMACIWLPLLFGISVITLAWLSRTSLWVHVRVNTGQDEWPRRIAISLPLPLRLGGWFFRTFQDKIPGIPDMEDIPIDDFINAVQDGVKPETPIYIEVKEKGEERVEVYIG